MNVKNTLVSLKDRVAVGALLAVASAASFAQETGTDQGVEAINALSSKAATYIAAAFTVAVLVAGGFWGIRMMKKSFSAAK
jgi:hypothetical protein